MKVECGDSVLGVESLVGSWVGGQGGWVGSECWVHARTGPACSQPPLSSLKVRLSSRKKPQIRKEGLGGGCCARCREPRSLSVTVRRHSDQAAGAGRAGSLSVRRHAGRMLGCRPSAAASLDEWKMLEIHRLVRWILPRPEGSLDTR